MRVSIEDAAHHNPRDNYPQDLIHFTLREGARYYNDADYAYGYKADSTSRTDTRPGPYRPSNQELNRQTWRDVKGLFSPKRLRPPAEVAELAGKIHATNVIDDRGALGGNFLPVSFLAPNELAIIKRPDIDARVAEEAVLDVLKEHFGVADIVIEFFPIR